MGRETKEKSKKKKTQKELIKIDEENLEVYNLLKTESKDINEIARILKEEGFIGIFKNIFDSGYKIINVEDNIYDKESNINGIVDLVLEDENGEKHEGGRRRTVLKEFLGDTKIKSLQSDGYSVYMYLDDELVEVEHLCCLAHVRNKFKDAYN